jgi:Peptidase A4 family
VSLLKNRVDPADRRYVRLRLSIVLLAACSSMLALAPAAVADTSQSANWAGYAVHRSGTSFSRVLGEWRKPRATCARGNPTYSAIWVGLGGFSLSSSALEQIGTELDCRSSGSVSSTAWYEFVPAASRTIRFTVRPGDLVSANAAVSGSAVVLSLSNLTEHRTFSKTLHGRVDISSAEWIVEAPSNCFNDGSCQTLQLANFGSASFRLAAAQSTVAHTGSISDASWDSTQINLLPNGRRFVDLRPGADQVGTAVASVLGAGGNAFSVTYRGRGPANSASVSKRHVRRAGQLVHPTRS